MFTIETVYKSIVKRINQMREDIISMGISTNMGYYAWDSRGQVTELPNTDLIGLAGWTYAENEGLPIIQAGIVTSMLLDLNQFREVQVMDVIRNYFVYPKGDYGILPLFDNNDQEIALLQVSDFEIMAAGRSEVRSTRNIAVELIRASGD